MTDSDLIVRIAAKGDGITADGRHVPLSAPGDRLTTQGLQHGPHHASPPCAHFPDCGGCQLQHLDEESLAVFVRDRVGGALAGQGVEPGQLLPAYLSPPFSRRRASLKAERKGRQVEIGFSSEGSHRIVDMRMCDVLHPAIFALVAPLRALLQHVLPDRRAAYARATLADQGVDLLLEGIAAEGLAASESLTAFAQHHALARLTIDDGFGPQTLWEPDPVTVTFGGVAVPFLPFAFLQATADGEAALLDAAAAALGNAKSLADLFCGLGTFALGLGEGRLVYAAEAARDAVLALKQAGNRAQRRLGVEHRDLFRRPLTPQEAGRFDAVLLDPPRAGAREQAAQLAQAAVGTIVYISCNPSSFARDAKTLVEGGYVLESVLPVGQFRWSTHVELVGIFRHA